MFVAAIDFQGVVDLMCHISFFGQWLVCVFERAGAQALLLYVLLRFHYMVDAYGEVPNLLCVRRNSTFHSWPLVERGGCENPSHFERLFLVIDAFSRWPSFPGGPMFVGSVSPDPN